MNTEWQKAAEEEVERCNAIPSDILATQSADDILNSQRILIKAELDRFLDRGGVERLNLDNLHKLFEIITHA